ncbi:MAG: aldo/keto reductase [Haloferacaceae archaeon]
MEYTTLGSTGTTVSRICLGCMGFGDPGWRDWVIDEAAARPIIERAIDAGITFFDTANVYSYGESERILGSVLGEHDRDRFVVATKAHRQMDPENPNSGGLSRKALDQELANSLDRLGMETVDLYQLHNWDRATPIGETLRALDDAVRRGRVRHLGASSMWTYQFATALRESDLHGLERFATMQAHYNAVYREKEREMIPFCAREGIGVLPYSPLARGYLARPHGEFADTRRGEYTAEVRDDYMPERVREYGRNGGREINARVAELAEEYGVSMAQMALAWLLDREAVDAPIVGVTSPEHVDEAVEALEVSLAPSDAEYLAEPYRPGPVLGHE